jgi:hypothetical protein
MQFNREYEMDKNYPVLWLDRSESEENQKIFIANQEGSFAILSLEGLKGWAKNVLVDHLSYPEDEPLDMSGVLDSLLMNEPGAKGWIPVKAEIDLPGQQLLIRYKRDPIDSYYVCDTHRLEV